LKRPLFTLACTLIALSPALARAAAREGIHGLGLDALNWGMSADQVAAALPALKRPAGGGGAPATLSNDLYVFQGCKFRLEAGFTEGKLSGLTLKSYEDDAQCGLDLPMVLYNAYGGASDVQLGAGDVASTWSGQTGVYFTQPIREDRAHGRIEIYDNR